MKQNRILTETDLKAYIKECVKKQLKEDTDIGAVLKDGNPFQAMKAGKELAQNMKDNVFGLGKFQKKGNNNGNNTTVNADVQKPIQEIEKLMREGILGQKMGNKFIEYLKKFGNH